MTPCKNRRLSRDARVFKLETRTFLKLCEAVTTPRSVACYMLVANGEFDQYLELSAPDPESDTFADDYLVTEALRKNKLLPTSHDPEKAAMVKWLEAESACGKTNEFLREYHRGRISLPNGFEDILTKWVSSIANVLGPLNREKLEYAEEHFRFGPGATSSCSGRDVVPSKKMLSRFDATPGLLEYWPMLRFGALGRYACTELKEVPYNKVTFVPKTAKTHRAIAIEPHMNIFVQLGIGALLRRCLTRAGLDLDSQAARNCRYASLAQKLGLVTIDLSSASDTISLELVRMLLPPDWVELLELARCSYSLVGDQVVRLNKFSSMGNGYTFELESLLFFTLALACGELDPQVFGDDIIVSKDTADVLLAALNLFGFEVNKAKTFLAGRFFESCGADYWNGVNVRPCYFRGSYEDFTSAVIRIGNKIRLYARRRGFDLWCDARFRNAWVFVVHEDPRTLLTCVPLDFGDDGLISNWDERPNAIRPLNRADTQSLFVTGWRVVTYRYDKVLSDRTVEMGAYLTALAFGSPGDTRLSETVRGKLGRARFRSTAIITGGVWNGPGEWLLI